MQVVLPDSKKRNYEQYSESCTALSVLATETCDSVRSCSMREGLLHARATHNSLCAGEFGQAKEGLCGYNVSEACLDRKIRETLTYYFIS